jgi:hypothetical protein
MENVSNVKYTNQESLDNYNLRNSKYSLNQTNEKLGFDVKEKRFKDSGNINPGPGEYLKNKKNEESKNRAKKCYIFKK